MIARLNLTQVLPLALAALLCAAAASPGQDKTKDAPPKLPADNTAPMKRISWLVGTWVGESELADYGKMRFKYTFAWAMNKNFLKADSWLFQGDTMAWHDTGMIGWDKDNSKYTTFIFGLDGTIGSSTEVKPSDPKATAPKTKLVMDGQTTGNSPWKRFRSIMLQVDADTMIIDQLSYKDGKYDSIGKTTLKRQKLKANPKAKASGAADKPVKAKKLQSA